MDVAQRTDDRSPKDLIAETLREEILGGGLPAGQRLIEESIARRFGVSRVPVREALAQLESEGFVLTVRYRGATVAQAPRTDGLGLLQVRRGLEVLAAQLAAERRGGASVDELAAVARSERPVRASDGPSFHELVVTGAGNSQLATMLADVNRRVAWALGDDRHGATLDHMAIAHAIVSGAVVQAGFLMEEHLRKDEERFAEQE
ncbi:MULTISPECIES: GntR family transcriptional regulator [unclassified Gordonia (in: high G+C Gram-positive bacteria)]|uniref:GntR family transcriptional regulator n=1 Tax=unclassified Gordonia (in: high G+C Gram-positive bacteria) TaxID=2657482 RepID=UPI0009AD3A49|nr:MULTISPECIES: GntR family transcriptional regulator [unclassified Gordonia (in: high G+C Gram-positive bacteria)]MDF3282861.1 GntR family transcriptional regulator [Gordonia sp. N1V]